MYFPSSKEIKDKSVWHIFPLSESFQHFPEIKGNSLHVLPNTIFCDKDNSKLLYMASLSLQTLEIKSLKYFVRQLQITLCYTVPYSLHMVRECILMALEKIKTTLENNLWCWKQAVKNNQWTFQTAAAPITLSGSLIQIDSSLIINNTFTECGMCAILLQL